MKILTIISGVFLDPQNLSTVNKSFDGIIKQYTDQWDKIHLVCPSNHSSEMIKVQSNISDQIFLTGIRPYQKNIKSRLRHFFGGYKKVINTFLKNTGILEESDCIQLRFPNYFVLMIAYGLKSLHLNTCFYIAGNEVELIGFNHPFLVPFAKIKRVVENYTMRGRPLITTGDTLANVFKNIGNTYSYYSTTHTQSIQRLPRKNYQHCLYVGSIYEAKRTIDLVKAINILKTDFPNVQCTIVGSGPSWNDIKDYVETHQLQNRIHLPGYITDREELKKYYNKADFLILPSLSEGTPRVFPEAMSQGVIPLGVKNVASNNYIMTPYKNGALFKKKSPQSIANELAVFFNDRAKYENALIGIHAYAEAHTLPVELEKMWNFIFNQLDLESEKVKSIVKATKGVK